MRIAAGLVKLVLFWILAGPLIAATFRSWRRRWSFEWTFAYTINLLQFAGFLFFGVLDYIPYVGKWFRLSSGILNRFDPGQPLESLAGFLIAYGSTTLLCTIVYLILFGRILTVPENSIWIRLAAWVFTDAAFTGIQDWIFRGMGLSDPHLTDFAVVWSEVAKRAGQVHSGPWTGPLEVAGTFFLLWIGSLLFHLVWQAGQGSQRDLWNSSRLNHRPPAVLVGASLLIAGAWWYLGLRLAAGIRPELATPQVFPSLSWAAWYGGVLLFVTSVVAVARWYGKQRLGLDARSGYRLTMVSAGLLWSVLAAAGVAGLEMHLGRWTPAMAQALPSPILLRYAAILLAQSLAASLLLHSCTLHSTASIFGPIPAVLLAAAGYCMLFGWHAGATWGETGLLLVLGIFLGQLYWRTHALWLPVSFQFGWWLCLGPLLGFPVAPLKTPAWENIWRIGARSAIGNPGDISAMVPVIGISILLLYFLHPVRRTAPIDG